MRTTYNPFTLQGKTILVTGASSGIGRSTAIECSRMGATLFITGRDTTRLTSTFEQLEGNGHVKICADLTDSYDVNELVSNLSILDGVVHSAGIIMELGIPSSFIDGDDMTDIFIVNVMSIVNLNSELILNKKLHAGSSIVHLSSISALKPFVGLGPYSITKGALLSYSKTLAIELASKKIRVNSILPALVSTKKVNEISKGNPYYEKEILKYPFGYGTPEDVSWLCLYLLSDAARWITGAEFIIDGGRGLEWK